MSENHQPKDRDKDLEQPVTEGQDQKLDDASLKEVAGGASAHEMKKALIGNLPR